MLTGDKVLIDEMITNQLQILTIVMSATIPESGILFMGKNIKKDESPKINIYLVHKEDVGFRVEEKLRFYKFRNLEVANSFINQVSEMSALGILFVLSGQVSFK